ncbi:lipoprotein [Streptomyces longisporoflavus]|uniref:hypothetical protein n=1 Tax=Streptomyces longisporoflavus TaxID=28044 RepID=UPI00167D690A|nr:hypothetical protein [Streptomyces longisporoflavus]GGV65277.1 lipoprotein [Streptomyces longisporoflavus]
MNRSRALPAAVVSLTAATALLLTGCGGGGDDKDSGKDKIAGADEGGAKKTASPSDKASDAGVTDRPEMKFPSDVQLTFDKANVSDPAQTAAANDAENFVKAIRYGIVKQDTEDAAYKFYSEYQSPAFTYAKDQIKQRVDAGFTISGEMRFTKIKVEPVKNKKSTVVSFCSDSSKLYSKEVKTKKVHHTKESISDFDSWQVLMTASDSNKGLWRAKQVEVATKAEECR